MGSLPLPRALFVASLVTVALLPAPVRAQDTDAPAHIAFVEGAASLERDGQVQPVEAGTPYVAGDRLRTTGGRVEILFPDGTALDVDEFSSVDLQSATLLRLTGGRLLLTVPGATTPDLAVRYQIDTPTASVSTGGPGEYRVAIFLGPSGPEAELAVLRGEASITTERGSIAVRAGERSLARDNEAPSLPQAFNSARFDAFDRWASVRRDARLGTAPARYLPRELHMYGGAFDRYGAWLYEAPHGYVWYPSVAATWRPYYDGYWRSYPRYGWTWVGGGIWSWPTHHYGRWGYARSRWFWIPDRRWGPAWVSWAAAPGYVSWCPLGFDNRPVFGLSFTIGNPWAGWVVLPRRHFGARGYYVNRYAIDPHRVPRSTPFVVQATAPVAPPRAVPRGVAVPRGGSAVAASPSYEIRRDRSSAVEAGTSRERAVLRGGAAGRTPGDQSGAAAGTAPAASMTRERTFRQALPDVRRAVPRDPAARAPQPGSAAMVPGTPSIIDRRPRGDARATRPVNPGSIRQPNPGWNSPGTPGVDAPTRAVPRWNSPGSAGPRTSPESSPAWTTPGAPMQEAPARAMPSMPPSRAPEAQPARPYGRSPRSEAAPTPGPSREAPRAMPRGAPAPRAAAPSGGGPSKAAPQRPAPSSGSGKAGGGSRAGARSKD